MTETQRERVPRTDGDEVRTALTFLGFARSALVKKLDGLDDEQARRVLVPTGTNLLGLVQHSTAGERYWFRYNLLGEDVYASEADEDWDAVFSMDVAAERSVDDVVADYRKACAASDTAVASVGDPASLALRAVDGELLTMRWILAHMVTETTRHAGHADILRELLDGVTGR